MLIGQICKRAAISKDAVRHYEAMGLIRSVERPAGSRIYRDYSDDTIYRLELIAAGKALGFRLGEMQPWLDLFVSDELSHTDHVRLVGEKILEIEERIDELRKIKRELTKKLRTLNEELGA